MFHIHTNKRTQNVVDSFGLFRSTLFSCSYDVAILSFVSPEISASLFIYFGQPKLIEMSIHVHSFCFGCRFFFFTVFWPIIFNSIDALLLLRFILWKRSILLVFVVYCHVKNNIRSFVRFSFHRFWFFFFIVFVPFLFSRREFANTHAWDMMKCFQCFEFIFLMMFLFFIFLLYFHHEVEFRSVQKWKRETVNNSIYINQWNSQNSIREIHLFFIALLLIECNHVPQLSAVWPSACVKMNLVFRFFFLCFLHVLCLLRLSQSVYNSKWNWLLWRLLWTQKEVSTKGKREK